MIEYEEFEEDTHKKCETCEGSGEVGPYGWEYPEYDTCPDCKGSGLQRDWDDPDAKHDRKRDDAL